MNFQVVYLLRKTEMIVVPVLSPRQVDTSFLPPAECGSSVSDQCQVSIWEQLQVLTAQHNSFRTIEKTEERLH